MSGRGMTREEAGDVIERPGKRQTWWDVLFDVTNLMRADAAFAAQLGVCD